MFAAEASGPTHDKVHPRIGITAKWIWSIYAGITCILVALLMLGGMAVSYTHLVYIIIFFRIENFTIAIA